MKGDSIEGSIRWRMHIPVPPEKLFAVLDSDDGRAAFWAESAIEFENYIEFRFINGYTYRSKILERHPPKVLSIDYLDSTVRFELFPDGCGGTDLLLTNHGVALEEWNDVHAGWLNVLFPLKAWVVHGVDLRNHDPQRTWDQGYADQ